MFLLDFRGFNLCKVKLYLKVKFTHFAWCGALAVSASGAPPFGRRLGLGVFACFKNFCFFFLPASYRNGS